MDIAAGVFSLKADLRNILRDNPAAAFYVYQLNEAIEHMTNPPTVIVEATTAFLMEAKSMHKTPAGRGVEQAYESSALAMQTETRSPRCPPYLIKYEVSLSSVTGARRHSEGSGRQQASNWEHVVQASREAPDLIYVSPGGPAYFLPTDAVQYDEHFKGANIPP